MGRGRGPVVVRVFRGFRFGSENSSQPRDWLWERAMWHVWYRARDLVPVWHRYT